jgi:hypothetical protein
VGRVRASRQLPCTRLKLIPWYGTKNSRAKMKKKSLRGGPTRPDPTCRVPSPPLACPSALPAAARPQRGPTTSFVSRRPPPGRSFPSSRHPPTPTCADVSARPTAHNPPASHHACASHGNAATACRPALVVALTVCILPSSSAQPPTHGQILPLCLAARRRRPCLPACLQIPACLPAADQFPRTAVTLFQPARRRD